MRVLRLQTDIRLADAYDAAQARGEVASSEEGWPRRSDVERLPTAADIDLTRKQIHESRKVRDAISEATQ